MGYQPGLTINDNFETKHHPMKRERKKKWIVLDWKNVTGLFNRRQAQNGSLFKILISDAFTQIEQK